MKSIRLVSAIVAVGILLTSCAGYRKGSEVRLDEKTVHKQYSLNDEDIDDALRFIEEILGWYYEVSAEVDPEKQLSSVSPEILESSELDKETLRASLSWDANKATYDSAAVTWMNMTKHLTNRRYKDAYDLYMKKYGDLLVHLAHSTARFTFLQEIGWPLIQEFEQPDSAIVTYCDHLSFEYWMQVGSIQFSSVDHPYIPEVFPETVREYGMVLSKVGRWNEALGMADALLEALIAQGFDEMHANTERAKYGASVMYHSGHLNEAIEILVGLKKKTQAWLEEDIDEDPDSEEYYRYYIDQLDKEIEKYMKEADYVSVYDI